MNSNPAQNNHVAYMSTIYILRHLSFRHFSISIKTALSVALKQSSDGDKFALVPMLFLL